MAKQTVENNAFKVGRVIKSCKSTQHFKTCANWMLDLVQRDILSKNEYTLCSSLLYKQFVKRIPKLKQGIYE